jgi:REP element-mobilizing transposase RayT
MSVVADVGSEPHAPLTTLQLGDAATLLGMGAILPQVGASLLAMRTLALTDLSLAGKLLHASRTFACRLAPTNICFFVGASLLAINLVGYKPLLSLNKTNRIKPKEGQKMVHQPHTNRLRTGRHSQASFIYSVTTVTADRQPIFTEFSAARSLIRILHHPDLATRTQTLAYVVMPDHLHWLFQLGNSDSLSQCVQRLKSLSAKALHPDLWQKGFHDRAIRQEEDLSAIGRYIVSNPVRAGLVSRVGAYPHWDAIWV